MNEYDPLAWSRNSKVDLQRAGSVFSLDFLEDEQPL